MKALRRVALRSLCDSAGRCCRLGGESAAVTCYALRVKLLLDAAMGMHYLHTHPVKPVVHLDLKCQNLLIAGATSDHPVCKVADFGLSVALKKGRSLPTLQTVVGTPCWMAPEILDFDPQRNGAKVDARVDIFSFGMVMWEALTGKCPFEEFMVHPKCELQIANRMKTENLRPSIPAECEDDYRLLMEACWAGEPSDRPTFEEIKQRLEKMLVHPKSDAASSRNVEESKH